MKFERNLFEFLTQKALWIRQETLKIHKYTKEIRIASCLSDVEIFTVLYYGKILNFDPANPQLESRDRFVISKGHGAVSLYPILADLDFFDEKELKAVCQEGSNLGSMPDCSIPGFEVAGGSLGHGIGIAAGMAWALKKKEIDVNVFVLLGDGELFEGSVWEAIMFASHHKLDNLIVIIDNNRISMLGYCKNIINLEPLDKKFEAFNWKTKVVDGHNVKDLYCVLKDFKEDRNRQPKVVIANTIKGKGVPKLEKDPLCHIKSLNEDEIDKIIKELK